MFYGIYKLMTDRYRYDSSVTQENADRVSVRDLIERRRIRRVLLARSDRQLADMGFSRDLLSQGVKAWPWQSEPVSTDESGRVAAITALASHRHDIPAESWPASDKERQAA